MVFIHKAYSNKVFNNPDKIFVPFVILSHSIIFLFLYLFIYLSKWFYIYIYLFIYLSK